MQTNCSRYATKDFKIQNRKRWQLDLAQWLAASGIEQDWGVERERERPKYMRSVNAVPCGCGTCYFCVAGITTGVAHRLGNRQREHDAALAAQTTHKWVSCSSNKCGWCVDERVRKYSESPTSARKKVVTYSTFTCSACDSLHRPICKTCRLKAAGH